MIVLEQVSKVVSGVPVLADVNLRIARGESVAVIGTPPDGPVMLGRIACTLAPPSSGRVQIDGIDARREPWRARRQLAAAWAPPAELSDLTVGEYLAFIARARTSPGGPQGAVDAALADAELDPAQPIGALPGTHRQRLGFVAASAAHVPILVVHFADDEDRDWRRRWVGTHRARGATLLMTARTADAIDGLCDRTLPLDGGRL